MDLEKLLMPGMIDRALKQTHEAGLHYVVIPEPWLIDWISWIQRNGSRWDFWDLCLMPNFGFDDVSAFPEQDGDRYMCLLACGHDGPCGYESVLNAGRAMLPIAQEFSGALTLGRNLAR